MKDTKGLKGAVFFDRDGTINEDVGYLSAPEDLRMISGAAAAIKRLNAMGVQVIVVSNQSGVGRGYFKESDVEAVNERLLTLLAWDGAAVDGVYYCVHAPDEDCDCRKPRAGLAITAAREHSIDLKSSYVVGDKASDMGLAEKIGAKAVLVLTGEGEGALEKLKKGPDFVASGIAGAVDWIIEDMAGRAGKASP